MADPNQQSVTPQGNCFATPDSAVAKEVLRKILDSPEFSGAGRIQAFLEYVVNETLEGRGDRIRGKTIVEDVYGRSPLEGQDPVAVVRVDAGRLRRRLAKYYEGTGNRDELKVHFEPGSYAPHFMESGESDPAPEAPSQDQVSSANRNRLLVLGGMAAVAIIVLLWSLDHSDRRLPSSEDVTADQSVSGLKASNEKAVREALFSRSPARLQASSLAAEARNLLFPALEPRWQAAVLQLFEVVIDMDENYFGGYAGAAESMAMIAITLPDGPARDAMLQNARASVSRAQDLGIDQGWSHAAAALVAMAERDFNLARREADRAVDLAPEDVHSLSTSALVALFDGDFGFAKEMAGRTAGKMEPGDKFPVKGIQGTADFHLGSYEVALGHFQDSILDGDPISPISLGYLAAIYEKLGERDRSGEMLDLLETAWPGFPMEALYRSLFREPRDANTIIDALRAAGWHQTVVEREN